MEGVVTILGEPYYEQVQTIWREVDAACGLRDRTHLIPAATFGHYSKQVAVYPSDIFGMPVFDNNRIYVAGGGDIWWGKNEAWLKCFEARGAGLSLPLAVLFFCWIATMWRGSMTFETPMLFATGFIVLFGIAGLTGLVLADVAADAQYHHSYFVVAHFHYVMMGGTIIAFVGGLHMWWPKMFGKMYNEFWGKLGFWITFVGTNMVFRTMMDIGVASPSAHGQAITSTATALIIAWPVPSAT